MLRQIKSLIGGLETTSRISPRLGRRRQSDKRWQPFKDWPDHRKRHFSNQETAQPTQPLWPRIVHVKRLCVSAAAAAILLLLMAIQPAAAPKLSPQLPVTITASKQRPIVGEVFSGILVIVNKPEDVLLTKIDCTGHIGALEIKPHLVRYYIPQSQGFVVG